MKILDRKVTSINGFVSTAVMTEGAVNDVAVYVLDGVHDAETVARDGLKMSERDARVWGLTVPHGKHYRR